MNIDNVFKLKGKIGRFPGVAAWHFTIIPKKDSAIIKSRFSDLKRGWGSLVVLVSTNNTKWRTSIFPDTKTGTYILPVKKEILNKENISEGKSIVYTLEIIL